MEKYESTLKFKKYEVNEIYFKKNNKFEKKEDFTPVELNIIPTIQIENNNMDIILLANIFEGAEEKNYPFEMKVELKGYFSVEADTPDKFQRNAIAILYPYIRAIVSTYTANANISPLILPAINVNKLIEDKKKD